ncbi:RNA-binding protein YlmH, contains S4-like domain [Cetobacterium ceti]|uniref:RNA-binding protein YlmH, contains S4-like domain n=1 Tax=Cetobacterium ceti TaxID=180163 RepID=A0A1T4JVL5_9FUSO|nr:YlmH/Sll1252 family protein [Cetobacterium ceti]SJZ34107.1 RNA-binding protein YlmH, contains S4-like domain [Cetobacterium ceti]
MNKKTFLSLFQSIDEYILANLFEDILLSEEISYPVETNLFFPPNVWKILAQGNPFKNLEFKFIGINSESEKRNIIISPKDFNFEEFNPDIIYFKMDCSNKFKTLEHKDFLGTIMSLGLKREAIGDIILKDNIAYSITKKDTFSIIEKELKEINKIKVSVKEIFSNEIPPFNFKNISCTVSSIRLDSIVSNCTNLSRNEAVSLIENGQVLINYILIKNKSFVLKEKDIITIKKYGKFLYEEEMGKSKKDKFKILLKKYI